jgi:chromosomal replication initiation ATPase DnaA
MSNYYENYHILLARAAHYLNLSHSLASSSCRSQACCMARYAVWHTLRATGMYSLPDLARLAGYRHHGAIINGLYRARILIRKKHPQFTALLTLLQPKPQTTEQP